jgi:archaeal flagellin FlaB
MFKTSRGMDNGQRGITGLETAIILIAFVVVASVFAFTVLSTGIFASERSKETVFAGLDEVRSSLEPRGSIIAYKGRFVGDVDSIFKIVFTVSNAVQGESINLTPPYTAGGTGDDPDLSSGAQYRTIISYTDENQFFNDVPWSVTFPGYDNSDNLLDPGEKAEITVWLADDVTGTTDTSAGGIDIMDGTSGDGGTGGYTTSSTVPGVNDKFTIEVKPESGATLNIERTLPGRLDTIMDLR